MLDSDFHKTLTSSADLLEQMYLPNKANPNKLEVEFHLEVKFHQKEIELNEDGAYSIYNWELFFHIPMIIAVHLSKNQRYEEAQRWFHYVFNPTAKDGNVWRFIKFQEKSLWQIDELLLRFSEASKSGNIGDDLNLVLSGYQQLLAKPFQPHVVARTRPLAYQYHVVMKYLDNLIDWGDNLFRQDTMETINEAAQIYIMAANLLGPKPQKVPSKGEVTVKTFAQLESTLDELGNTSEELEGQMASKLTSHMIKNKSPVNPPPSGIGRTLYFCIPQNDKLLGYWDTVADRLFKIRHCMNIEGMVRQLPLFEPALDPGMLVKAAAAGINVNALINGLNQPLLPVRSLLLIQKALELCGEVRSSGNALLAAIEKQESEKLGLLRQNHEINIQKIMQDIRFLQWKEAESSTESLLNSRKSAVERYHYYQRLLGEKITNDGFAIEHESLDEDGFDQVYQGLIGKYAKEIENLPYSDLHLRDEGNLKLLRGESREINDCADTALAFRTAASGVDLLSSGLAIIPDVSVLAAPFGVGAMTRVTGGSFISNVMRFGSSALQIGAQVKDWQGHYLSKIANYERRADDWTLQSNLAAIELMQIGRQIISSLIREQITKHEYESLKKQIKQSEEVKTFLESKFTNENLYSWMQGELSRLHNQYYKFAFDIARKAEQSMKHELMRPELDKIDFIKFNYWDAGHKGLLAGDTLYFDLKRMEMAYHEHNKREYELTKHISLRRLNPLALLQLKTTGTCEVNIPEWLFDMDAPGHYLRRIKNISLSIPAVTGAYTNINCTLSLQRSAIRKNPVGESYPRSSENDDRFIDYYGMVQSIVTSHAQNDSGLFETNLRDERFLPFEGHGVISTWRLDLPTDYKQFDYNTISDVILHMRYTARQGIPAGTVIDALNAQLESGVADEIVFGQLFFLRSDFSSEWHRYINSEDASNSAIELQQEHFPYFMQGKNISLVAAMIYGGDEPIDLNISNMELPHALSLTAETREKIREIDNPALVVSYKLASAG